MTSTAHVNGNGRALSVLRTYAEHGQTHATCPVCRQAGRVTKRPGGVLVFDCYGRCDGGSGEYLSESAAPTVGPAVPEPLAAAAELGALLGLDAIGVEVHGARVVGRGSRASADLYLSDDTTVTFEALRDIANSTRLTIEIVSCTGAVPKLKAPQAVRALVLIRSMAAHHETLTADEIAIDWGMSYLQSVELVDVNIDDQVERWGAFSMLHEREPRADAYDQRQSVASANVVLRHSDGTRFVRCGWYREVVRSQDPGISPQELAHRMERVGWRRRGATGRIKATRPGQADTLAWSFYLVPTDWEARD